MSLDTQVKMRKSLLLLRVFKLIPRLKPQFKECECSLLIRIDDGLIRTYFITWPRFVHVFAYMVHICCFLNISTDTSIKSRSSRDPSKSKNFGYGLNDLTSQSETKKQNRPLRGDALSYFYFQMNCHVDHALAFTWLLESLMELSLLNQQVNRAILPKIWLSTPNKATLLSLQGVLPKIFEKKPHTVTLLIVYLTIRKRL